MIGSDLIRSIESEIKRVKYDDAVIAVRVDGAPESGDSYHAIQYVTYDDHNNLLIVAAARTPVPYEALHEGWKPDASDGIEVE